MVYWFSDYTFEMEINRKPEKDRWRQVWCPPSPILEKPSKPNKSTENSIKILI